MYEADDFGANAKDAAGIGLGDSSAESRLKRRMEELNMTLAERLASHESTTKATESTTVYTKGQGVSRRIFICAK
jgi:hypothetical protein